MARQRTKPPEQDDEDLDLRWERAVDVEHRANILVQKHHPRLQEATIRAYFKPKASKKDGKTILADIRRPTPLIQAICADLEFPVDFIITVGRDRWDALPEDRRDPYVDHELCHATRDPETDEWMMRAHDVEEFVEIVQRWGTSWRVDLDLFARACTQLPLPGVSQP